MGGRHGETEALIINFTKMASPAHYGCLVLTVLSLVTSLSARVLPEDRKAFINSTTALPSNAVPDSRALNAGELATPLEFEVALQMRNFPGLIDRIGRRSKVLHDEMVREHFPHISDHEAIVHWLLKEGFTITSTDDNRLSVFAVGTVDQIQKSLQVKFGLVAVDGVNYVSALGNPNIPAHLAQAVLAINGLQPYLKMRKRAMLAAATSTNSPPYLVSDILGAYNAQSLGVTGSGQKIAILIDTLPRDSDVTSFWTNNSIPQSLGNLEKINVNGAALASPSGEETLDVEWSSGIAPGAKVRIYAAGSLSFTDLDKALQRIISDLPSQPQLHQLSISLGLGETYMASGQMQTDAQFFATLANAGVSTFVSSGDGGSNPNSSGASGGPLQVEYYSSDPSVTGVGGSSLTLNTTTGAVSSETAWAGSGGGISQTFSRPSWQTGPGVTAGSKRLVPDVCSVANPNTGAYVYLNGAVQQYGGTSWSTPVWAGYSALINEARERGGLPPVGLFNPSLYPLIGTSNFRDITSGNNGSYSAGVGFDMVTGIGVPSVNVLMQTLAGQGAGVPIISGFSPTSGMRSSTVVISGLYLADATSVTFNGVSAGFVVNSGVQITATVPSSASSGVVAVTNPQGTAISSGTFNVVLSTGTLNLFSTGFETAEGYPLASGSVPTASSVSLSGTMGWLKTGIGGQGLLKGAFSGSGQQAFLGFTAPTNKTDTVLWKPTAYSPVSGDVVHFSVQMSIADSTNSNYDKFSWSAFNSSNQKFFTLFFRNDNNAIGYNLEGGSAVNAAPTLLNGHTYNLQVDMNFGQNSWSATLDGISIASNQPITTTGSPLNFGYMGATWHLLGKNSLSWGNNYMVFDNYSIGRGNPSLPIYNVAATSSAPDLGTVAGGGSFFSGGTGSVTATAGTSGAFVVWMENGNGVSRSSQFIFPVMADRNLVANFQPATFSAWQAAHFSPAFQSDPGSGAQADPDGDGIINLLEYASNLDPKIPNPSSLPAQTGVENGLLTLTYFRNMNASDLAFSVEVSSDLLNWDSGAAFTSAPAILGDDGFTQIIKVNDLTPVSSASRRFIRLRVSGQ